MQIHSIRHIVAHTARKHRRGELANEVREDDKIMAGMDLRDMVCVGLALIVLVGAALWIEHEWHLDGDVVYDASAAIGAHPLSRGFRRVLDAIV